MVTPCSMKYLSSATGSQTCVGSKESQPLDRPVVSSKGVISSRYQGCHYLYNVWDAQCLIQRQQMVTHGVMPTSVTVVYGHCFVLSLGQEFPDAGTHALSSRVVSCPFGACFPLCASRGRQGAWSCLPLWSVAAFKCSQSLLWTEKKNAEYQSYCRTVLKWLIEINLKWHCGARHFAMTIFIYLTMLHASCVKRLSWETTLFYWLLF